MAIYHFSAKVISRANGSSALAAAAYRSASRLHDQRLDRHHDFSNKAGVVHSDVMLPDGAPEEWRDRESLWNAVEAAEVRKDAQLAREVEFALPRDLDQAEGIRLAREFVEREFVKRGMIADLNVHWDIAGDGEAKPHAHVMLTTREVDEGGLGAKVRDWNRTDLLRHWRESWAEHVNTRLAELDIDARVDHRSLEAQGIELEPQNKIGPAPARMEGQGLESERLADHAEIARSNGDKLLARPALALDAITHSQATFTTRDLAMFVHRHSDGKDQFDRVMAAVKAAPELVALGKDGRGDQRFTSRDMLETEQRLERAADRLSMRVAHGLPTATRDHVIAAAGSGSLVLGAEQQTALSHVLRGRDLAIVAGYAGTGKSAMLSVARDGWERAGFNVTGAALSGIAAENLEGGSGISSRTLAGLEHQWSQDRDLLTPRDVLVIDEAGMIGSRQMERVLSEAEKRGAKVVLVGDPEQLQAIEAGAAFRSLAERHGAIEITEVRRQREDWQREATRHLATERTGEAIHAYAARGAVHAADTREQARADLIERWDRDRQVTPDASRIILTHTNDEVHDLNLAARDRLRGLGALGEDVNLQVERGARALAAGDRIMFLRNERSLGVKNGSLGTVQNIDSARLSVMLDDGRAVAFDVKDYAAIDHGYAATIHKAQGMTVDRVHVLATPGLDRHAAYVALSRHRDAVDLHYGRDDFADQTKLIGTLSRERAKDMASDFTRAPSTSRGRADIDWRQISLPLPLAPTAAQAPAARVTAPMPAVERHISPASLEQAVVAFAKATAEIVSMRKQNLDELPHQRASFDQARVALDGIRPDGARDLRAAFARDIKLIDEFAAGKAGIANSVMDWEQRHRTDPQFRADHFVKTWRQLGDRHEAFERRGEESQARRVVAQMTAFAHGLERDPQVESLLRKRPNDLGVPPYLDRPLSQALPDFIGWGRGRGIGR
jgi:Ti-type conjugative transfer relaxase TraA